jgi:uncharacterized protein
VTIADRADSGGRSSQAIDRKIDDLRDHLRALGSVIIGFSGGIDSAFLLKVAVEALGDNAVALTAVSASLPQTELDEAVRIAREFGARHELVESDEIHNPAYAANPTNRCFFCKQALFVIAESLKSRLGIPHVAIGTNLDDLGDHRPGLIAAEKHGALHPLVDLGFDKSDVREAAKRLGIGIWDKPAFACLSSRFPYGVPITEERLNRIAACEDILRALGFRIFRVRFHGELVRIELGPSELERVLETPARETIISGCRDAGFEYVTIDLEPYRSGRLNEGKV